MTDADMQSTQQKRLDKKMSQNEVGIANQRGWKQGALLEAGDRGMSPIAGQAGPDVRSTEAAHEEVRSLLQQEVNGILYRRFVVQSFLTRNG